MKKAIIYVELELENWDCENKEEAIEAVKYWLQENIDNIDNCIKFE